MGLRSTIQKAAKAAMDAVGDLKVSVTYTSIAVTGYTPSTGAVAQTNTVVASVPMVFSDFDQKFVDEVSIRSTDKQGYLSSVDATALGVPTPKPNDTVLADSVLWYVVSVQTDPAEALYILHLRQP